MRVFIKLISVEPLSFCVITHYIRMLLFVICVLYKSDEYLCHDDHDSTAAAYTYSQKKKKNRPRSIRFYYYNILFYYIRTLGSVIIDEKKTY